MKTLVIHPKDYTTRFLAKLYEGKDWKVIRDDVTKKELKEQMMEHDRIIMLGHGLPDGLLGFGKIVVDERFTPILRKKEVVCVWCNADRFVEKHKLKGFYTGMIISEKLEAEFFDVEVDDDELLKSNWEFAYALQAGIDHDNMADIVKENYVGDTPIYNFNKIRIYSNL